MSTTTQTTDPEQDGAQDSLPTVVYAQCSYDRDWEDTKDCIERMHEGVDHIIIVTDQTISEPARERVVNEYENVHVLIRDFKDSLPEFRNHYVREARDEYDADWLVVSDPDEQFNQAFADDIKELCGELDERGWDAAGVNCHDQFDPYDEHGFWDDLDELKEYPDERAGDFYKNLVLKMKPDLRYIGIGGGDLHETVKPGPETVGRLPEDYYYTHTKTALEVWRSAARNVVLAGGGDSVKDLNPYYERIHALMDDWEYESWQDLEEAITTGCLPDSATEFFTDCLEAPNNDWGRETRQLAKFYFAHNDGQITDEIIDRIENPPERSEEQKARDKVRKVYFELLGRHPDGEGLENYVEAIIEDGAEIEDIKQAIRQSAEYQEHAQSEQAEVETISVTEKVPINVDIGLNDEILTEILTKTEYFEEHAKRRIDLAKTIEDLADTGRIEEVYEAVYRARELNDTSEFEELLVAALSDD